MRSAINKDIEDLRRAFPGTKWSVAGPFFKVKQTHLWVFKHPNHIINSAAEYSNFSACVSITFLPPCMEKCPSKDGPCEIIQAFFYDNVALETVWSWTNQRSLLSQLHTVMDTEIVIDNGLFATGGNNAKNGLEFAENIWTKRLVGCLNEHMPNHTVTFTANEALNFQSYQDRFSQIGTDKDVMCCYLFQGVNDFMIKHCPVTLDPPPSEIPSGSPPSRNSSVSPLSSLEEYIVE